MAGLGPNLFDVTVTTAGTRVQVSSTPILCSHVRFEADGTSTIYVGDSTVSSSKYSAKTLSGATSPVPFWELVAIDGAIGSMFDLSKFWVDGGANGAKCHVTYFDRTSGGK